MAKKTMYDIIKKQNGEQFAKAIRNHDNGIFDIPGLDEIVKYAGRDAGPIMEYLTSLKGVTIEEQGVYQNPIKLLDQAGYDAYVVTSLKQQNAIKKYFERDEELCTFRDSSRFKNYYIINAVRKDVDKIKRSATPEREDEYGTSVLSIQILKTGGFISIKNRYNHTVTNPDNTLNSNPDNIIHGLSAAIKHHFNVDFSAQEVCLPHGYIIVKGHICRFKFEMNNTYCAESFYIRDGMFYEVDKSTQIMLGAGLLLDLKSKTVSDITKNKNFSNPMGPEPRDLFVQSLNHAISEKKLQIANNPLGGRDIIADGKQILTVEDGELVNINIPNADTICLGLQRNLRGVLDFSNVKHLHLSSTDLSQVSEIKFNPNAEKVSLVSVTNIPTDKQESVDFGGVKELDLHYTKCTIPRTIILNPNATRIEVYRCADFLFESHLDLGNVQYLALQQVPMNMVQSLKTNPNAKQISIQTGRDFKMSGDHDFSNVEYLRIEGADMSRVGDIKFNPNAENISLSNTNAHLRGELDFSNVLDIHFSYVDVSDVTNIKFQKAPPQGRSVTLSFVQGLKVKTLDLGTVSDANISYTDLSQVSEIKFNPKGRRINFDGVRGLHGTLDMRGPSEIHIQSTDLGQTNTLISHDADFVELSYTTGLSGEMDFSEVQRLRLFDSDLSRTYPIHFNAHAKAIDIRGTKGLRGDLDFSGTEYLNIDQADLSNVTSIKLSKEPGAYVDMDKKTIQLRVGRTKLEYRLASLVEKVKGLIQNEGNEND